MTMPDADAVRAAFPGLTAASERVFLDNPAGTQVCARAIDAMVETILQAFANDGGPFPTSERFAATIDKARGDAATFVGASDPQEIVFGSSMTAHTFAAARAIARTLSPGDEVLVTRMDHEGNVSPWLRAAEDFGLSVRWLPFDGDTWRLEPGAFADALTSRTKVAALNHASNMTGAVNDIAALTAIARDAGVLTYVDGVQAAPHILPDVEAMGADFYVTSAYKYFGPHVSVLWARRELLESLPAERVRCGPTEGGAAFERGTPQVELLAGLSGALSHLAWLGGDASGGRSALERGYAAIAEHELPLASRIVDALLDFKGVRLIGPPDTSDAAKRVPTISFVSDRQRSTAIAAALGDVGINVWSGHNYAFESARQLGLDLNDGVVRLGLAHYNTASETERTLQALDRIL